MHCHLLKSWPHQALRRERDPLADNSRAKIYIFSSNTLFNFVQTTKTRFYSLTLQVNYVLRKRILFSFGMNEKLVNKSVKKNQNVVFWVHELNKGTKSESVGAATKVCSNRGICRKFWTSYSTGSSHKENDHIWIFSPAASRLQRKIFSMLKISIAIENIYRNSLLPKCWRLIGSKLHVRFCADRFVLFVVILMISM